MAQNGSTSADPLIDLTKLVDDFVELDGARYGLTRPAILGLRRQRRCEVVFDRMRAIELIADDASESDEREYHSLCREIAGYALPGASAAVLDALDDEQLGDLAILFFGQAAVRSRRLEALRNMTSGLSLPDSNASTAATPSDGST